jgi:hypothetical protein
VGLLLSLSNILIFQKSINHYAICIIWFLVPLSTQFIIKFPMWLAHTNLKSIDQGWIELPQLIHSSVTINNSLITIYHPQQASQIVIISSICVVIFISSTYSSNLILKYFTEDEKTDYPWIIVCSIPNT